MDSFEAWKKQAERLEFYKKNHPELLAKERQKGEAEVFREIGIGNIPEERPAGYIRLYPEDFIVEERRADGISRITRASSEGDAARGEKENTLYATLIKIGIPTNIAIERISAALEVGAGRIGYAGLKDADAVTGQLISISGIRMPIDEIRAKKIPNIYLKDFYYGKGALTPGSLEENIFTITVRTREPLDERFRLKIENIRRFGILNYYQSQRFGGSRLISHKLGKLILQGNYELAIRYFLFKASEDDIPLVVNIRKRAESLYPDFTKIREVFEELPYWFHNELKALAYLEKDPKNFIGALIEMEHHYRAAL